MIVTARKRLLAIVTAVFMCLGCMNLGAYSVYASYNQESVTSEDDQWAKAEAAEELTLGQSETVNIDNAGDAAWFKFTPTKAGTYIFSSNSGSSEDGNSCDPYGALYIKSETSVTSEAEYQLQMSNDDIDLGGGNYNFAIAESLEADTDYYLCASMSGDERTGSYTVFVKEPSVVKSVKIDQVQPDGQHPPFYIDGAYGRVTFTATYSDSSTSQMTIDISDGIRTASDSDGNSYEVVLADDSQDYLLDDRTPGSYKMILNAYDAVGKLVTAVSFNYQIYDMNQTIAASGITVQPLAYETPVSVTGQVVEVDDEEEGVYSYYTKTYYYSFTPQYSGYHMFTRQTQNDTWCEVSCYKADGDYVDVGGYGGDEECYYTMNLKKGQTYYMAVTPQSTTPTNFVMSYYGGTKTPNAAKKVIPISSISLEAAKTINAGQSIVLTATVAPANATDKVLTWTSSNTAVATVINGTVKGVAAGTAVITVTAPNGKAASCTVTVNKVQENKEQEKTKPATKLSVAKKTIYLKKGSSSTISTVVAPLDSTDKVKFKSSNKNVVTVDSKGKLKAKKKGKATITITAGKKTVKVKVNVVTKEKKVKKLSFSKKSMSMEKGKVQFLSLKVNPSSATQKITWKSSKKSVATVDSNGKITAKKKGRATITAKANGKTAKITITVK